MARMAHETGVMAVALMSSSLFTFMLATSAAVHPTIRIVAGILTVWLLLQSLYYYIRWLRWVTDTSDRSGETLT